MGLKPGAAPNNPTGKGGFQKGQNGWLTMGDRANKVSAGKRMIDALSKAAMIGDGETMEHICRDIVQEAKDGSWEARNFLFNRVVGLPKASVEISEGVPGSEHDALAEKFIGLLDGMAQRKDGETVQ